MYRLLVFILFISVNACTKPNPIHSPSPLDLCHKNSEDCGSVDIDNPKAKEAYQIGCDANNAYSCFRLGQYFEIKSTQTEEALKAYSKSCFGHDTYGCESETNLRAKLCYIDKVKTHCTEEPKGEYRILVYLETLDPKYQDALITHNYSYDFSLKEVKQLYEKRIAEKNKKLLATLRTAKKGNHDGDDGESLQYDIWRLEGNKKMLEPPY